MGRLKPTMPRVLFVSDFDGALIRTNTDTLIFQKLNPLMDNVVKAVIMERDGNIRLVEQNGLLPLMRQAGAKISKGRYSYSVQWAEAENPVLPESALKTVIGKRAIQYYGTDEIPAREFLMSLIPGNAEIDEYLGGAQNAWSAYEQRFRQFLAGKTTQLGFHEFTDAVFTKLFKYSDVVEASRQIAKNDIREGVGDLFELLCSKGAHIAICSYSYVHTVQIVLKDMISKHTRYVRKVPFSDAPIGTIVANRMLRNDLNDNAITGIVHIGNKWRTLDSKLADLASLERDSDGRYLHSIAYEDDPNSVKEMGSRFRTSVLLIKEANRGADIGKIKADSGIAFDDPVRLETCLEENGGVDGLAGIVKKSIEGMERSAMWPFGSLLKVLPLNRGR